MVDRMNVSDDSIPRWHQKMGIAFLLMPSGLSGFSIGRFFMVDRMDVINDSTPKWHQKMGMAYLLMPSGSFGFGTE